MLSGQQIRAARAYLGWTQAKLAGRAGLSLPVIQKIERDADDLNNRASTLRHIRLSLEAGGIEFLADQGIKKADSATVKTSCVKTGGVKTGRQSTPIIKIIEGQSAILWLWRDLFKTEKPTNEPLYLWGSAALIDHFFTFKPSDQAWQSFNRPAYALISFESEIPDHSLLQACRFTKTVRVDHTLTFIYRDRTALYLGTEQPRLIVMISQATAAARCGQFKMIWRNALSFPPPTASGIS